MKLKSIQILTDENISPKLVKNLRDQGLDVLDIKEEGVVRKSGVIVNSGTRAAPLWKIFKKG